MNKKFFFFLPIILTILILAGGVLALENTQAQTNSSSSLNEQIYIGHNWRTINSEMAFHGESSHPLQSTNNGDLEKQITYGLTQEPDNLNPFLTWNSASKEVYGLILDGLIALTPDGELYPVLAVSVPTVANGGVSPDGLTVTYTLKSDIYWSDGELFTCDDVVFTYEAVTHTGSGAVSTTGYDQINVVECDGDFTAIIKFNTFYTAYYTLFDRILPRHATGYPADMENWGFNNHPIGTGPFTMVSWNAGGEIIVEKNPLYRAYPSKPLVDRIIIRFLSSLEEGKELIRTGAVDILVGLSVFDMSEFQDDLFVDTHIRPSSGVERLLLNFADPTLDATDDPINNPHWALGQNEVRQAIQYGIDKNAIIDQLLNGMVEVGTTDLNTGWSQCVITPTIYSPTLAITLLTGAGWTDLDLDGVRECNGCPYAATGTPLRLKIQTTTGNQLRLDIENMLVNMMAQIGIELYIENVSSSELFGSWESGAFRKHGNFDILMYTSSGGVDPHLFMYNYFHSSMMPTYANGGLGWNYVRWINTHSDAPLDAAGATSDLIARKIAYQTVCDYIAEDIPHLYLFQREIVALTRNEVQGFQLHPDSNETWNATDWDRPCCEVNEAIGTSGGEITSYYGDATLSFPAASFSDTVIISFDTVTDTLPTGSLVGVDLTFEIAGVYSSTGQTAELAPGATFTFTVSYTETEIAPAIENTLSLYYMENGQWIEEPTSDLDTLNNIITATPDHFSYWAILGEHDQVFIFLPLVLMNQ
jgi:peptide/nickel transport system substrate-binding protein